MLVNNVTSQDYKISVKLVVETLYVVVSYQRVMLCIMITHGAFFAVVVECK